MGSRLAARLPSDVPRRAVDEGLTPTAMQWWEQAACAGVPTDLFFPDRGDRFSAAEARRYCARCPVSVECLYEEVELEDVGLGPKSKWNGGVGIVRYGLRGGFTADDRRRRRYLTQGFTAVAS